jgi:hypothetical protein
MKAIVEPAIMNEQLPIDEHTQDLLNGGVDGELNTAEQAELDGLLAESTSLHDQSKELKSLAGLLDNLPEVEPPTYLQESIERQIRLPTRSSRQEEIKGVFATWLPAQWMRTGFALAAGAVLTIGIYEMGASPMSAEDVSNLSGTIVPAEHYRAEQISSRDVEFGDEDIARLMQTDLFEQLVNDPAFVEAMRSDTFQGVIASDNFRTAMANDNFRTAMANDNFRSAMANEALRNSTK